MLNLRTKSMVGPNIALTLIAGGAVGFLVWRLSPMAWSALSIAGFCLLSLGFVFWTIARFQLGRSLTVTAQAKQLVTYGLYSKIRNPIYVFGSCVIAGLVLVLGHPIWLLIFFLVIPLQILRAGKESRVLEETFGEEYRRYRVGTWF